MELNVPEIQALGRNQLLSVGHRVTPCGLSRLWYTAIIFSGVVISLVLNPRRNARTPLRACSQSTTPSALQIHWFPVFQRLKYKNACMSSIEPNHWCCPL